jgi:pimeloyl-ACP methyl ester carboxylesterase
MDRNAAVVTVDGAPLAVHDTGGDGPAVVFLHGNLSRWQHWAPQLERLAGRCRCVAYDQRGFGASVDAPPPSSLRRLADDAVALCAELGITRAHVVGLSMGGAVAQAVAVGHPDFTAGLLLAASYRLDELHPTIAAFNATHAEPPPDLAVMTPLLRASFSPAYQAAHPEAVDAVVAEFVATAPATVAATAGLLDDFPLVPAPSITAPTIVVAGSADVLAPPEVVRHLAAAIPQASYRELDSGHVMNLERPDEFTDLVRELVGA